MVSKTSTALTILSLLAGTALSGKSLAEEAKEDNSLLNLLKDLVKIDKSFKKDLKEAEKIFHHSKKSLKKLKPRSAKEKKEEEERKAFRKKLEEEFEEGKDHLENSGEELIKIRNTKRHDLRNSVLDDLENKQKLLK